MADWMVCAKAGAGIATNPIWFWFLDDLEGVSWGMLTCLDDFGWKLCEQIQFGVGGVFFLGMHGSSVF